MNEAIGQRSLDNLLSRLQIGFALLVCFLTINPVFYSFNIKGSILLVIWFAITLSTNKIKVSKKHLLTYILVITFIFTSLVSSAINMTFMPALMAIFCATAILTTTQLDEVQLEKLIDLTTKIYIVMLIGALFGVAYHLLGGSPILTLKNPDGRENHLYLTTFSNAETFTIRPSGVFDEPGAFSFIICVLVALRSRLRLPLNSSFILIVGGLITQSIAHLFFIITWIAWLIAPFLSKEGFKKNNSIALGLLIFVSVSILIASSGYLDWALDRGLMYYHQPDTNPRYLYFINSLDQIQIDSANLWYGFSMECIQRQSECSGMGENPLTPLIYGGLLVAWPYYLFIATSFISIFYSRDGLLLFGISILLFQRPYLLEFPYSALIGLVYLAWIFNFKEFEIQNQK